VKKSDPIGWQGSTPPSLIQQRMAIDRVRTRGMVAIWSGAALLALGIAQFAISDVRFFDLLPVVVAGILIGVGIWEIGRYKRRIAAFEDKHGERAGSQDTVR
jgi:hypothetical protein